MIALAEKVKEAAKIKVIGVGGGGCNAVDRMISSNVRGVEFITVNTDSQALERSLAKRKILLGEGLGAGGNPDVGRKSAQEAYQELSKELAGADMVFVTAGMGGGTGTGGAPVISKIARESGALTVALVTKPFIFEGKKRMLQAEEGLRELRNVVDTVIIVPNQRLLAVAEKQTAFFKGIFKMTDDVLLHAVQGISEIITVPGLINVDFADVRAVMCERGPILMGTGMGKGDSAAKEAVNNAICNPLLEDTVAKIEGAKGVLLNMTGGSNLTLPQVSEAASVVSELVHDDANIFFGAVFDSRMTDEVRVTIIATGLGQEHIAKKKEGGLIHLDTLEARIKSAKPAVQPVPDNNRRSNRFDEQQDRDIPAFMRYQPD
ncbi:MAG: cell division protein FtsZ [Candidatus Schekmanbacteria bacterium]|nr:cell division protein FtsZ [Candidatus Schekmanbacteria bacterium]